MVNHPTKKDALPSKRIRPEAKNRGETDGKIDGTAEWNRGPGSVVRFPGSGGKWAAMALRCSPVCETKPVGHRVPCWWLPAYWDALGAKRGFGFPGNNDVVVRVFIA